MSKVEAHIDVCRRMIADMIGSGDGNAFEAALSNLNNSLGNLLPGERWQVVSVLAGTESEYWQRACDLLRAVEEIA